MKLLIFFLAAIFSFANTNIAVCANLKNPFKEIKKEYHLKANLFFDSSGELMSDILWYPDKYDIFISANKNFIDTLTQYKVCKKSTILTYATIVLISKNIKIKSINDLLKAKQIILANPNNAPIAKEAKNILIKLHLFYKINKKIVFLDNIDKINKYVLKHPNVIGISSNAAIKLHLNYYKINTKYYTPLPQTICLINKKSENIYNLLISEKVKKIFSKYGYVNEYKNNK